MTFPTLAALVVVFIPALIGWAYILRSLIAVYLGLRDRRRINSTVRSVTRMNDKILADNVARSPFLQKQMLHKFNQRRGVGNADVVELRRGKGAA